MVTKHLDIGCGTNPRNPFLQEELYGVDIQPLDSSKLEFNYTESDVILEKLPFEDSLFDSISCYDFLEHVPRVIEKDSKIHFPFVDLMNEIHRVLKNGGINIYTARHTGDGDYKNGIHRGEDLYENDGFIVHFFDKEKINQISKEFKIEDIFSS